MSVDAGRFTRDNYMRREFDNILRRYGHDVYLQRAIQPTNFWTDNDRQSDIEYKSDLEIHTVRFSLKNNTPLSTAREEAIEGLLNTHDRIYYFRYDANPFENDRIYEIEPRPRDRQKVFVIDAAVPMYGIGGNLVYWVCGATSDLPS